MQLNISTQTETTQPALLAVAQPKQKTASQAKRAHEVPAQIMPAMRKMIVGSFNAGRSIKQISNEYCVTQACALELVIRSWVDDHQSRRVANLQGLLQMPERARSIAA